MTSKLSQGGPPAKQSDASRSNDSSEPAGLRTNLQDEFSSAAQLVSAYLQSWVAERELPDRLGAALRYVLDGQGKRLRPVLCQLSCRALGGRVEDSLPAAGALELVHDFSLVHDDLPAMDDDDLRRGRPTLHCHADEATAILGGDALLALSFQLLSEEVPDAARSRSLTRELSRSTVDMIAGQILDSFPGDTDDQDEAAKTRRLAQIHEKKTGALIRAACRMGAHCAGASEADLDAISRWSEAIGLMFQIVDDLLDVTQTTEHLGKSAGKDADQGKLTYPGVLGIDSAKAEVERLRLEARAILKSIEPAPGEATRALETLFDLGDWLSVRTR